MAEFKSAEAETQSTWEKMSNGYGDAHYRNTETDWEVWKISGQWLLYAGDSAGTYSGAFSTLKEAKAYGDSEAKRITVEEAVERLQSLAAEQVSQGRMGDPEAAHSHADEVLLAYVPTEIREAYEAVQKASRWWAAG